jgi:hypothetical protein
MDAAQPGSYPDRQRQGNGDGKKGRLYPGAAEQADDGWQQQSADQRPRLGERAVREDEQNHRSGPERGEQVTDAGLGRDDGKDALNQQHADQCRQGAAPAFGR